MNMQSMPTWLRDHAIAALAAVLLTTLVPAQMLGSEVQHIEYIDPSLIVLLASSVSLTLMLLFSVSYWATRLLIGESVAHQIPLIALIWTCSAGLLFPLTVVSDQAQLPAVPLDWENLGYATFLTLFLVALAATKARRFAFVFLTVFLLVTMIQTTGTIHTLMKADAAQQVERDSFTAMGSESTLLVVSFDGVPGHIVYDLLRENSELKSAFRDFIFFKNTIATSPATFASMTGELFGNINLKELAENEASLREMDRNHLLIQDPDYDTWTYGTYNAFNDNPSRRMQKNNLSSTSSSPQTLANIYLYVATRVGTRLTAQAISYVGNRIWPDLFPEISAAPSWDAPNRPTIHDFIYFVENIHRGSAQNTQRFMHFVFSHYPVDFDENCTNRSHDPFWFETHQNQSGIHEETTCIFRKLVKLLDNIRKSEAYDKATIVLKSDHGKPLSYYDSEPSNMSINEHPRWGFDRYQPFLMIKPVDHQASTMETDSRIVLLDDLAKTLCHLRREKSDCRDFPGLDLLDPGDIPPPEYYVYVPEDADSHWRYDTHIQVRLPRNVPLIDAMESAQSIRLGVGR